MLFNSFDFIVFFIVVTLCYYCFPHRYRWLLLLIASCYFYMAFVPIYILILFGTIVVDYVAGILIENQTGAKRKFLLTVSIIANVGVLAVFKYYNFFVSNVNDIILTFSSFKLPLLKILLPIGLSFHTFQAMSYTIEVYRGNQKAERHFGIYSLYVMFYPQLVAGPIERPQHILYQFYEKHDFKWENLHNGLLKILWGVFKKVVIADRLAIIVGNVYNQPNGHNGFEIVLAIIFFSFQIYCDFSGYSDIAIGCAEVMGFKLMTNFNSPYFSTSISELWRRWHISLSSWFNDYLYNPIVGSLRNWGKGAVIFGLIFTFTLCGFWHGAAWKYVFFGLVQGIAIVYEFLTRKRRRKIFGIMPQWLNNDLSRLITFSYFSISLVFFRAETMKDVIFLISHMFSGWHPFSYSFYKNSITVLGGNDLLYGIFNIVLGVLLIILLLYIEKKGHARNPLEILCKKPFAIRWTMYLTLLILICVIGLFENKEFIYFQF